jgi:hypothetical protein
MGLRFVEFTHVRGVTPEEKVLCCIVIILGATPVKAFGTAIEQRTVAVVEAPGGMQF